MTMVADLLCAQGVDHGPNISRSGVLADLERVVQSDFPRAATEEFQIHPDSEYGQTRLDDALTQRM